MNKSYNKFLSWRWSCCLVDWGSKSSYLKLWRVVQILYLGTSVTHSAIASCATSLFLPHFDVICDLLLNRRTATWNLFVKGPFSSLMQRGRLFLFSNRSIVKWRTLIGYLFLSACTYRTFKASRAVFSQFSLPHCLDKSRNRYWLFMEWMNPLTTMNPSNETFTGRWSIQKNLKTLKSCSCRAANLTFGDVTGILQTHCLCVLKIPELLFYPSRD